MCLTTEIVNESKIDLSEINQIITIKSSSEPTKDNELRREKCKLAARSRRCIESDLYQGLADALPISKKTRDSLDKPSILRLTVSDLKLQELVRLSTQQSDLGIRLGSKIDSAFDSWMPNALNGFLLSMSADGEVIFTSDSISTCLGSNQCDVMGKSIYELTHPCDHGDIKELLLIQKSQTNAKRSGLIRFKSCLSSRGHNSGNTLTSYKVIHINGKLFQNEQQLEGFVGVCELIPHPSESDFNYPKSCDFVTRHSADMKFNKGEEITLGGFHASELIGKSLFDLIHGQDMTSTGKMFKSLYSKGQIKTSQYRILVKTGGWIWVETEATLMNNGKGVATEVLCRHFIMSNVENAHEILSELQYQIPAVAERLTSIPEILVTDFSSSKANHKKTNELSTVTYEIDLAHLAPVPSDESIPLNDELFEELVKFFDGDAEISPAELDLKLNQFNVVPEPLPLLSFDEVLKDLTAESKIAGSVNEVASNQRQACCPLSHESQVEPDELSLLLNLLEEDQQQPSIERPRSNSFSHHYQRSKVPIPAWFQTEDANMELPKLPVPQNECRKRSISQLPGLSDFQEQFQYNLKKRRCSDEGILPSIANLFFSN